MKHMRTLLLVCAVVMGLPAQAEIVEWSGAPGAAYSILQGPKTIEILDAGTFKFYSETSSVLDDINAITINSSVTGGVYLYIAHQEGGAGAVDVNLLNLSGGSTAHIAELRITGDLGDDGSTVADVISGRCDIGGDVLSSVQIGTLSDWFFCDTLHSFVATGTGGHSGWLRVNEPFTSAVFRLPVAWMASSSF